MNNEIDRKFFVKEMPDLSGITALSCERYFLERGDGHETRISKVGDSYIYEDKSEISSLERAGIKKELTREQFESFKKSSSEMIIREQYNLSTNPDIDIQIYHGRFEGLVRAEVEFNSEQEARAFIPPGWMGKEMTRLPIARDSKLLNLSDEEFKLYLQGKIAANF